MKYFLVLAVGSLVLLGQFSTISGVVERVNVRIERPRRDFSEWFAKEKIERPRRDFSEWFAKEKDSWVNWGSEKYNELKQEAQEIPNTVNKYYGALKQGLIDKTEELKKSELWKDIQQIKNQLGENTEDWPATLADATKELEKAEEGLKGLAETAKETLQEVKVDELADKLVEAAKDYIPPKTNSEDSS